MASTNNGPRRSQAQRKAETRAQLLDAARCLFVEKGFADTATPDIVERAGLTRGALYHHFQDKSDLFRAVAEREAHEIGMAIEVATRGLTDPVQGLAAGSSAYFDAMSVPGRARLLLVEAPAVLGYEAALALTSVDDSEQLREGLAIASPNADPKALDALADILSAAFDRSAIAIARGAERKHYEQAFFDLLAAVTRDSKD